MSQEIKNRILQTYRDFLETEKLTDQKVLLCVSGGVDSMVLLEVAILLQKPSYIAFFHLDHQHRKESKAEQKWLGEFCERRKIKFYPRVLKKQSEENHRGRSLENFWRTERKKMAEVCAQDFKAKRILTAHHATDLVETMIFRMAKGVGLSGLAPFDIHTKPFWQIQKAEIVQFAEAKEIFWFEDLSNQDTKFQRNLVHQEILPELRKITPNLEKVFVREHEIFSETQAFLEKILFEKFDNFLKNKKISLSDFLDLEPFLQKNLLRIIANKNISFSETENILLWLENDPNGKTEKKIGDNRIKLIKKVLSWD